MDELIKYMDHLWVRIEDGVLTLGLHEDALETFDEIQAVLLPEESSTVEPNEVCGELHTDQGPINIYCPVDGAVIEVNQSVTNRPSFILEDCMEDGWLLRIEAENPDQLEPSEWEMTEQDEFEREYEGE